MAAVPSVTLAWIMLGVAGLLEVVWAISLKYTEGFTRLWPSVFTLAMMGCSFYLLAKAVHVLPIGTAYAVWVGIGVLGASILGVLVFHEAMTLARAGFLILLIVAIAGLKLTAPPPI